MARGGYRRGGGGGGMMNQNQMLKQAQKMQQKMLEMQQEISESSYTAQSGGGAVSVTVSGTKELQSLTISPDAVDPEDVEMLQDMIIAAVNEALHKVDDAAQQNMSAFTGGIDLGGIDLGSLGLDLGGLGGLGGL